MHVGRGINTDRDAGTGTYNGVHTSRCTDTYTRIPAEPHVSIHTRRPTPVHMQSQTRTHRLTPVQRHAPRLRHTQRRRLETRDHHWRNLGGDKGGRRSHCQDAEVLADLRGHGRSGLDTPHELHNKILLEARWKQHDIPTMIDVDGASLCRDQH